MIWASFLNKTQSERREFPRIKTNNLIKETSTLPVLNQPTCNLVNLSEKGFQFNVPHWVSPQRIMNVVINLPEKGCQVEATVKIIWCRFIQRDQIYCRVGASFMSINDRDLAAIRSFINQCLGRSESRANVKVSYLSNRIAPMYFCPRFS